jgi:hypothetical protein
MILYLGACFPNEILLMAQTTATIPKGAFATEDKATVTAAE